MGEWKDMGIFMAEHIHDRVIETATILFFFFFPNKFLFNTKFYV